LLDLGRLASHEPLVRDADVLGVHDDLPLGYGPHQAVAVVGERDHGWRRAPTLGVLEHGGVAAFEHGYARVRRPQVDSDRLCHWFLLLNRSSKKSESEVSRYVPTRRSA